MIEGSCHCGAVRWRFEGTPEFAEACSCTLCRRYGVGQIPIDRVDGLHQFEHLPRDGRRVADYWC